MTLNKWIVFCKEFEIIERLYSLKNDIKELPLSIGNSHSEHHQHIKMRELKEIEAKLVHIFKVANKSQAKIDFNGFVSAVGLVFEEFQSVYSSD